MKRFQILLACVFAFTGLALSGCSVTGDVLNAEFKMNEVQISPQRCQLKPQVGQCKAAFTKYYFNPNTQRCEQFLWGGCNGAVPFENLESCHQSCASLIKN